MRPWESVRHALGWAGGGACGIQNVQRAAGTTRHEAQATRAHWQHKGVIAPLEGGRIQISARTLERLAKAVGTRQRITFEPDRPPA